MNTPKPGVDYWPDQLAWPKEEKPKQSNTLIKQAFCFIVLFILLQASWQALRDNDIGHFVRGTLTVRPAVEMIHFITPTIPARAVGNQILAPGGGLVIKIGCEGVEALFILIAALLSVPMTGRAKLRGVINGSLLIYAVNEVRILVLFYAFRTDKALFQLIHVAIAPLLIIAIAGAFYYHWLQKNHVA